VVQYLKWGKLVRPFRISTPSEFAYYFVCLPERLKEPKIAAFRAWFTRRSFSGAVYSAESGCAFDALELCLAQRGFGTWACR
jgi:hypothetical protein